MKIKDLVELLNTLDPEAYIQSYNKWGDNDEIEIMDVVDVKVDKQIRTDSTQYYLMLGCNEESDEPRMIAIPPKPYRASD